MNENTVIDIKKGMKEIGERDTATKNTKYKSIDRQSTYFQTHRKAAPKGKEEQAHHKLSKLENKGSKNPYKLCRINGRKPIHKYV